MGHELLFEIGTEEIPAGFILPGLDNLKKLLAARLADAGIAYGDITTAGAPRRLTVMVRDLADRQPDQRLEFMGPARKAAFDADNHPTKAALGFAASKGARVEDLQVVDTPKGEYVMLVQEKTGERTEELLPALLETVVASLPFPKSMRWGHGALAFARPIHWLLALYNGKVVPVRVGEIRGSNTTRGHRFMAPGTIEVADQAGYTEALRRSHVLVDLDERRHAVRQEIAKAAARVGGTVVADEELVDTVTNLVELPCGICGTFEQRFLALPDCVLITAMREHQKYFCMTGPDGRLLPHFIALNNTRVKDDALAAEGHQRVLRARLEDALFFFREDKHKKLADRVQDLTGIVFQKKLGTMLEKTERVQRLASHLAALLAPGAKTAVERTALLAKADLLTAMVNEFPSLQGRMGREYALLEGEAPEVAEGILEHYLPVRAGGELPQGTVGALVGIADRLDTMVGCFGIGQVPTGTTDPFGLRRLALAVLAIIEDKGWRLSLHQVLTATAGLYGDRLTVSGEETVEAVRRFIQGRFVNDLTARGIAADAVEAVTSVSFDDPVDARSRIDALVAIRSQPSFAMLAGAFKRVMNIIKDNADTGVEENLLQEEAERTLWAACRRADQEARPLLGDNRYQEALASILLLKEPVDSFFDQVLVMAEDEKLRRNRINLLTGIARLFLEIGDFSKMQG